MRTTLDIDNVALAAARAKADNDGTSLGRAVSELILKALVREGGPTEMRNGFPVLPPVKGHVVTDEMVAAALDDE